MKTQIYTKIEYFKNSLDMARREFEQLKKLDLLEERMILLDEEIRGFIENLRNKEERKK